MGFAPDRQPTGRGGNGVPTVDHQPDQGHRTAEVLRSGFARQAMDGERGDIARRRLQALGREGVGTADAEDLAAPEGRRAADERAGVPGIGEIDQDQREGVRLPVTGRRHREDRRVAGRAPRLGQLLGDRGRHGGDGGLRPGRRHFGILADEDGLRRPAMPEQTIDQATPIDQIRPCSRRCGRGAGGPDP